ncbi:MAG: sugar transferase [Bacteroidales bacterium]|jgi:exopolysaccharide biosynthesis polyprenyl glycosylphosphotransferase|nr:sugar transferase [Bacteroidales bacterium]
MSGNTLYKKRRTIIYIVLDILVSMAVWFCFFSYRKFTELSYETSHEIWQLIFADYKFYVGVTFIPVCWVILYALGGIYNRIWKKSRLREFIITFQQVLFGTLILFFFLILDDNINQYTDYIRLFLVLFFLQFFLTVFARLFYITKIKKNVRTGKIQFNTIIIGTSSVITNLSKTLLDSKKMFGNKFIGYLSIEDRADDDKASPLTMFDCLGNYKDINRIIKTYDIEEVIITYDPLTRKMIEQILPLVRESNVLLKIMPTTEDHMLRTVKNTAVFNEPYIQIYLDALPVWQRVCKRIMDIIISFIFIIVAIPLYIILAIGVKRSSPGPVFFRQERIGKREKPFHIIKFRSMYEDAEIDGCPRLSSKSDDRITPFGAFMRHTHLDEIPQFFNVLKGEMSLVGPRPERQYYIDKIIEKAPYYRLLLFEKPGITSWGQVSYGYAENVNEMIERLQYEIMYIENMSLLLDVKILFYTIVAVLKGNGK